MEIMVMVYKQNDNINWDRNHKTNEIKISELRTIIGELKASTKGGSWKQPKKSNSSHTGLLSRTVSGLTSRNFTGQKEMVFILSRWLRLMQHEQSLFTYFPVKCTKCFFLLGFYKCHHCVLSVREDGEALCSYLWRLWLNNNFF